MSLSDDFTQPPSLFRMVFEQMAERFADLMKARKGVQGCMLCPWIFACPQRKLVCVSPGLVTTELCTTGYILSYKTREDGPNHLAPSQTLYTNCK